MSDSAAPRRLNDEIEQLLLEFGGKTEPGYVNQLIRSALDISKSDVSTLDAKIAASALREMQQAFKMMAPFRDRKKVTIFGSARTSKGDPLFDRTAQISREFAERGWMVVTGAGPGIMEAGMVGAGRENSIGVSIRLPFETAANEVIQGDTKFVSMRYFFTRKLMLVKESHAFICMPGGFGTLDEMFELLTLIQTGKGLPVPLLLMDLEDDPFWESVSQLIHDQLLPRGLISSDDLALFDVCHSPIDAWKIVETFYSNYRSMRFFGETLVLRVNKPVSDTLLSSLSEHFGMLCVDGGYSRVEARDEEVRDSDELDAHRIAFKFARRHYGHLRMLINHLNQFG
jgi:uncharacterized protein (TIGR00730 family)